MDIEGRDIVLFLISLLFVVYLTPLGLDALSYQRDIATNESEQLDYYNSLSDADKANYTSDYGGTGEPPTPWSKAETNIFRLIGILIIIAVIRGIRD